MKKQKSYDGKADASPPSNEDAPLGDLFQSPSSNDMTWHAIA